MIPNIPELTTTLKEVTKPSRDYQVTSTKDRIQGYVDGIEAVKQAIYFILNTERYEFPVYSWQYGVELIDLIGKPPQVIVPEIKRRIRDALTADDRILSVDDFEFEFNKKKVHVSCVATTIYGDLLVEREVDI